MDGAASGGDRDLEALLARVRPQFTRAEPRRHAEMYVRGLLSDLARKNGWTLAAYAGAQDATSMQRMLNAARWDTDGVRDETRRWLVECFGDWRRGTLVVDEVRIPKFGTSSVGVHRDDERGRRSGNAQLAVFLTYVSPRGRALVDRELYLPQEWIGDRIRARRAGVPDDVTFADRDELATRMIKRAVEAHGSTAWVVAGGSLTSTSRLRTWLEERFQAYVLPISAEVPVAVRGGLRVEAGRVADAVPRSSWVRVAGTTTTSAGNERWALVALAGAAGGAGHGGRWENGLLLRRPAVADAAPTLYWCRFPSHVDLVELVQAARTESAVRASVRWANENIGLDHYQVRRYDAWYRHMTLCLIAGAYLACRARRGTPLLT